MCVCRGSPISGSFPTLLPSAFLILVELRPEAYSSPVQHCQKNLCMCQGLGVRGQLQPLGIDCFYCGLWPVLSVSGGEEAASRISQSSGRHCWFYSGSKRRSQAPCPLLSARAPTLFTLVWRRSLGRGVAGLAKRTRATGAKVGTFETRWGSPAASELGLERGLLLQPLSEGVWREGPSLSDV